jgi:hypothetical protein
MTNGKVELEERASIKLTIRITPMKYKITKNNNNQLAKYHRE